MFTKHPTAFTWPQDHGSLALSRDQLLPPSLLSSLPLYLPLWNFELGDGKSNVEGHMDVEGLSRKPKPSLGFISFSFDGVRDGTPSLCMVG